MKLPASFFRRIVFSPIVLFGTESRRNYPFNFNTIFDKLRNLVISNFLWPFWFKNIRRSRKLWCQVFAPILTSFRSVVRLPAPSAFRTKFKRSYIEGSKKRPPGLHSRILLVCQTHNGEQ